MQLFTVQAKRNKLNITIQQLLWHADQFETCTAHVVYILKPIIEKELDVSVDGLSPHE